MSVFKRSDGKSPFYYYEFQLEGRPFRGSTKRTTEREARAVEKDERERARLDLAAERERVTGPATVDEVFARYWKAKGHKLAWSYSVERHMRDMLAFFTPDRRFAEIGNAELAAALETYEAGTERVNRGGKTTRPGKVAPATVNARLAVFRAIYNTARDEWELPTKGIHFKSHKRKQAKERVRNIETDKARELIAALPWHILMMAAWSFATGCRLNETETLTWPRVNFETRQAEVLTKGGGTRFVNLGPDALHILSQCDRNRVYVFDSTNRRRHWQDALKKVRLKNFRWHDMRHCFATWAGNSGTDPAVLQRLLGHADIRTTMKYRHVLRAEPQKAVERLPTLLEGSVIPMKVQKRDERS